MDVRMQTRRLDPSDDTQLRRFHEILWRADARRGRDENARVAEHARWKDRYRDEGLRVAEQRYDIRGERQLGDLEFLKPQHAKERLLDHVVEEVDLDALGAHAPVGKRTHAIVIPAGQSQAQLGHAAMWQNDTVSGIRS